MFLVIIFTQILFLFILTTSYAESDHTKTIICDGKAVNIGNSTDSNCTAFTAGGSFVGYTAHNGTKNIIPLTTVGSQSMGEDWNSEIALCLNAGWNEWTFLLDNCTQVANTSTLDTTSHFVIRGSSTNKTNIKLGTDKNNFSANSLDVTDVGNIELACNGDFQAAQSVVINQQNTGETIIHIGYSTKSDSSFKTPKLDVNIHYTSELFIGYAHNSGQVAFLATVGGISSESTSSRAKITITVTKHTPSDVFKAMSVCLGCAISGGGTATAKLTADNITVLSNEDASTSAKRTLYIGRSVGSSGSKCGITSVDANSIVVDRQFETIQPLTTEIGSVELGYASTITGCTLSSTVKAQSISVEYRTTFVNALSNDIYIGKMVDVDGPEGPRTVTVDAANIHTSWIGGVIDIVASGSIVSHEHVEDQIFSVYIGQRFGLDTSGSLVLDRKGLYGSVVVNVPQIETFSTVPVTSFHKSGNYLFSTLHLRNIPKTTKVLAVNMFLRLRDLKSSNVEFQLLSFDFLESARSPRYVTAIEVVDFLSDEPVSQQETKFSMVRITEKYSKFEEEENESDLVGDGRLGKLVSPYDSLTIMVNRARHDYCPRMYADESIFTLFSPNSGGKIILEQNTHKNFKDKIESIIAVTINGSNFDRAEVPIDTKLVKSIWRVTKRDATSAKCPPLNVFVTSDSVLSVARERKQSLYPFYGGIALSCKDKFHYRVNEVGGTGFGVELAKYAANYGEVSWSNPSNLEPNSDDINLILSFQGNENVSYLLDNLVGKLSGHDSICEKFAKSEMPVNNSKLLVNEQSKLVIELENPSTVTQKLNGESFKADLIIQGTQDKTWRMSKIDITGKSNECVSGLNGWNSITLDRGVIVDNLVLTNINVPFQGSSISLLSEITKSTISITDPGNETGRVLNLSLSDTSPKTSQLDITVKADQCTGQQAGKSLSIKFGNEDNGVVQWCGGLNTVVTADRLGSVTGLIETKALKFVSGKTNEFSNIDISIGCNTDLTLTKMVLNGTKVSTVCPNAGITENTSNVTISSSTVIGNDVIVRGVSSGQIGVVETKKKVRFLDVSQRGSGESPFIFRFQRFTGSGTTVEFSKESGGSIDVQRCPSTLTSGCDMALEYCVVPDPGQYIFNTTQTHFWNSPTELTGMGLNTTTLDSVSGECKNVPKVTVVNGNSHMYLSESQKRLDVDLQGVHSYPIIDPKVNEKEVEIHIYEKQPPDDFGSENGNGYYSEKTDYKDNHRIPGVYTIEISPNDASTIKGGEGESNKNRLVLSFKEMTDQLSIDFTSFIPASPKCKELESTTCEYLVTSSSADETCSIVEEGKSMSDSCTLGDETVSLSYFKHNFFPLISNATDTTENYYLLVGPYESPNVPIKAIKYKISIVDSDGVSSAVECEKEVKNPNGRVMLKRNTINITKCVRKLKETQGIFSKKLVAELRVITDSEVSFKTSTLSYRIVPTPAIVAKTTMIDASDIFLQKVYLEISVRWDGATEASNPPTSLVHDWDCFKASGTTQVGGMTCKTNKCDFSCTDGVVLMNLSIDGKPVVVNTIRMGPININTVSVGSPNSNGFIEREYNVEILFSSLSGVVGEHKTWILPTSLSSEAKPVVEMVVNNTPGPNQSSFVTNCTTSSNGSVVTASCPGVYVPQTVEQITSLLLVLEGDGHRIITKASSSDSVNLIPSITKIGLFESCALGTCQSGFKAYGGGNVEITVLDLVKTAFALELNGTLTPGCPYSVTFVVKRTRLNEAEEMVLNKAVVSAEHVVVEEGFYRYYFVNEDLEGAFNGEFLLRAIIKPLYDIKDVALKDKDMLVRRTTTMCEMTENRCAFVWDTNNTAGLTVENSIVGVKYTEDKTRSIYDIIGEYDGINDAPNVILGIKVSAELNKVNSVIISNEENNSRCELNDKNAVKSFPQMNNNVFNHEYPLVNNITNKTDTSSNKDQCRSILAPLNNSTIGPSLAPKERRRLRIRVGESGIGECPNNNNCIVLYMMLYLYTKPPMRNDDPGQSFGFQTSEGDSSDVVQTIPTSKNNVALQLKGCFRFAYRVLVNVTEISSEFGITGSSTKVKSVMADYIPLQHPTATSTTAFVGITIPSNIQQGIFRVTVFPLNIFHTAMLSSDEYSSGKVLDTTDTQPDPEEEDPSALSGLTIFFDSTNSVLRWEVRALGLDVESIVNMIYGSTIPLSFAGLQMGLGVSGVKTISVFLGETLVAERILDFVPPNERGDTYRLVLQDDLTKALKSIAIPGETVNTFLNVTIKTFAGLSNSRQFSLAVLFVADGKKLVKPQILTSRKPHGDPATFRIHSDNSVAIQLGGYYRELVGGFSFTVTLPSELQPSTPLSSASQSTTYSMTTKEGEIEREFTIDEAFVRQYVASTGDELIFDVDVSFKVNESTVTTSLHVQYKAGACAKDKTQNTWVDCGDKKGGSVVSIATGVAVSVVVVGLAVGLGVGFGMKRKKGGKGHALNIDIDEDEAKVAEKERQEAAKEDEVPSASPWNDLLILAYEDTVSCRQSSTPQIPSDTSIYLADDM